MDELIKYVPLLALALGIVAVWVQTKTDIAKIQVQIAEIREMYTRHGEDLSKKAGAKELDDLKGDIVRRLERMEDKIDKLHG